MRDTEFDAVVQELGAGATRRSLFRLIGGAAAGGLGLATVDAIAKSKGKHHGKAQAQHHSHLNAQKKHRGKHKKGKHRHHPGGGSPPPGPIGPHFSVSGRSILDSNGTPVLFRGVNKMSVFDDDDPTGAGYFPEIRKTHANTVRIVWAMSTDTRPSTDPGTLDALIATARANRMVPMIELHDATGDFGLLSSLVDYWTQPNIVGIIQKHQSYLLVNIGNEVGDGSVDDAQFINGYSNAVHRMRNAGIHTPLVIDAPDFGKNLDVLNDTAGQLLADDPDHNLIFSVHMYYAISDGADVAFLNERFNSAIAANYPLIVGEFSITGGVPGNGTDSSCGNDGDIDYQTIMNLCDNNNIGWYAWEWGPGNIFGGGNCDRLDMTDDGTFATLKFPWGVNAANRIQATAQDIL